MKKLELINQLETMIAHIKEDNVVIERSVINKSNNYLEVEMNEYQNKIVGVEGRNFDFDIDVRYKKPEEL